MWEYKETAGRKGRDRSLALSGQQRLLFDCMSRLLKTSTRVSSGFAPRAPPPWRGRRDGLLLSPPWTGENSGSHLASPSPTLAPCTRPFTFTASWKFAHRLGGDPTQALSLAKLVHLRHPVSAGCQSACRPPEVAEAQVEESRGRAGCQDNFWTAWSHGGI